MAVPGELIAPDGIIIRPIPGAVSHLASVVVGVIPPREQPYPVHLHLGLEQLTYVLRGVITATWRGPGDAAPTARRLRPGEAIATAPLTSLSFANHGRRPAEVLFICVPPYPASNADTRLVPDGHRVLDAGTVRRGISRHRLAAEYLASLFDARIAALRWILSEAEPEGEVTPGPA